MPTISLASNAADSEALETIERQHAELVGGLSTRTAALLAAVRRDAGWEGARDALVTWCRAALIRHHEAEEAVLYPATRELPALEPLVRAMAHEHALLGALVARLASTDDAPSAVAQAGAAQTLFETHVAKANDLLLPALVAARDTSVAQLLAEMHTMLRGAEQGVAEAAKNPEHRPAEGPPGHVCGCHDVPDAAP
ncbi:MAG: hemerythrin domain-containing protein [Nitriliruptor sp.]